MTLLTFGGAELTIDRKSEVIFLSTCVRAGLSRERLNELSDGENLRSFPQPPIDYPVAGSAALSPPLSATTLATTLHPPITLVRTLSPSLSLPRTIEELKKKRRFFRKTPEVDAESSLLKRACNLSLIPTSRFPDRFSFFSTALL